MGEAQIGDYQLEKRLQHGATGRKWRAGSADLERQCAPNGFRRQLSRERAVGTRLLLEDGRFASPSQFPHSRFRSSPPGSLLQPTDTSFPIGSPEQFAGLPHPERSGRTSRSEQVIPHRRGPRHGRISGVKGVALMLIWLVAACQPGGKVIYEPVGGFVKFAVDSHGVWTVAKASPSLVTPIGKFTLEAIGKTASPDNGMEINIVSTDLKVEKFRVDDERYTYVWAKGFTRTEFHDRQVTIFPIDDTTEIIVTPTPVMPESMDLTLTEKLERKIQENHPPSRGGATASASEGQKAASPPKVSLASIRLAAKNDPPAPQGAVTPGSRDDVLLLEGALSDLGYLDSRWVDGSYGTKTIEAMKVYQVAKDHHDLDGIPGPIELAMIGVESGKFTAMS